MSGMAAPPGPDTVDRVPVWLDVPFAEKDSAKAAGARVLNLGVSPNFRG